MQGQTVSIVAQAIRFIEDNLDEKTNLDAVAEALHYSKFYLHRLFTKTVGMTIHEYTQRRRLTEAAKRLVFSKRPIMEIALAGGYESRQAFTDAFKAMYKLAPAEFREANVFYPLQLEIHLKEEPIKMEFGVENICFAGFSDVNDWLELVRLTVDGFPCLNEEQYYAALEKAISEKRALMLRDDDMAVGVMIYSTDTCSIDFLAVHPQYRNMGVARLFVDKLANGLLSGKDISITTYRKGDRADTGYRDELSRMGFEERELLVEFGYPTQRFVLANKQEGNDSYAE